MMSEDNEQFLNEQREARHMLEEFFDRHEFPEDLEKHTFYGIDITSIYKVNGENNRFLLEIKFGKWQSAEFAGKLLSRLFDGADKVSIFRIGKKLFLRKFLF